LIVVIEEIIKKVFFKENLIFFLVFVCNKIML
jgi:hypothetical protein